MHQSISLVVILDWRAENLKENLPFFWKIFPICSHATSFCRLSLYTLRDEFQIIGRDRTSSIKISSVNSCPWQLSSAGLASKSKLLSGLLLKTPQLSKFAILKSELWSVHWRQHHIEIWLVEIISAQQKPPKVELVSTFLNSARQKKFAGRYACTKQRACARSALVGKSARAENSTDWKLALTSSWSGDGKTIWS